MNIPTLESLNDTIIYIYYGNSSATKDNDENEAWDPSYLGVYHLAENTTDKTASNSASPTNYGGTGVRNTNLMSSTGEVNGAYLFDGNSDYINLGDMTETSSASKITYEAWVKPTSLSNWRAVITKQTGSNYTNYTTMQLTGLEGDGGANDVIVCVSNGIQACGHTASANIISAGVMHHWMMVYDGTLSGNANRLKFYLDGVQKSLSFLGTVPATTANLSVPVYIGNAGADSLYFPGVIDEVRVSNTARSQDWVTFEYANINNSDNEISYSAQETASTTAAPGSPSSSSYTCPNVKPESAPDLFQIDTTRTQATLYFTPVNHVTKYFISYSTTSIAEEHAVEVDLSSAGVQSYTINLLSPGEKYYFKVRGHLDCTPGDWSNIMSANTKNISTLTTAVVIEEKPTSKTLEPVLPPSIILPTEEQVPPKQVKQPVKVSVINYPKISSSINNLLSKIFFGVGSTVQNLADTLGYRIVDFGYKFITDPTIITTVNVEILSPTQAKISWETNQPANSKVNYGEDETYGHDVQNEKRVKQHVLVITDLKPSTRYYFEVMSHAKSYVYDANREFTTPAN